MIKNMEIIGLQIPLGILFLIAIVAVIIIWKLIKFAIKFLIIIVVFFLILFGLDILGVFDFISGLFSSIA